MSNAGAAELFEKALNSHNIYIRQAAAEELCNLIGSSGFSEKALKSVRREAVGSWGAAFAVLGNIQAPPDKKKVLEFLLTSSSRDEAALYTLRECKKYDADFFSDRETAAIEGHFSAVRSRFGEALGFFRIALESGPEMFFAYPGLLNDLGRSFQYADSADEGAELFLKWENSLAGEKDTEELRFGLFFFAARIARQRGHFEKGIALFEQALPLAPDSGQAGACLWYILDSALSVPGGVPDAFLGRLEQHIHQWRDDGYFDDVLDKFSRELILKRDWKNIIRVFSVIQNKNAGASAARYAWIIGRAIEEGYLSQAETQLAAQVINADDAQAADDVSSAYKSIAYNCGVISFYYRFFGADRAFPDWPQPAAVTRGKPSAEMEFLLGFFNNSAPGFAPRYIRVMEKNLSVEDLRVLSAALADNGLYLESMRLVSVYSKLEGYAADRRDMELQYPRPFRELVEKYAAETGVAPSLLFGLIRTESAFQSDIVSAAGAIGLTQLMPATAGEMAGRIRRAGGADYLSGGPDGLNLRDPEQNIHIGAYYLGYLQGRFDNTLLSLLAYNGGMNRIRRWRAASGFPPDLFLETVEFRETREYGRRVIACAEVYRELYYRDDVF